MEIEKKPLEEGIHPFVHGSVGPVGATYAYVKKDNSQQRKSILIQLGHKL